MSRTPKLPPALAILMNGRLVGRVERNGSRLSFIYDEHWRQDQRNFPLSLSMPLTAAAHGHETIKNWISGLLPDNERIIARVANAHDVSPDNPYALIWKIGEDCPGATQFVEPENIGNLVEGGDIVWLTEDQVADRLAELRRHGVERRHAEGNFSLPGAQPKTALVCLDGRWGVPSGRLPTTYILKPPIDDLEGHAENEVFCLALARKLGLAAAEADVLRFRDEIAISIKRYDRAPRGNGFVRVHQEDMCQAMSVPPANKYERDGGPGIRTIMRLLAWSTNPGADRTRFMDAIALNFLIYGSDAHAKNYSLLFGPPRRPGASWEVRLAPLYDVASYLPYATRLEDIRMPMKVGQHRHYEEILPRHWEQMSASCDYPTDEAVKQVIDMAERIPAAAAEVAADLRDKGIDHPVLTTLVEMLHERCEKVLRAWRAQMPVAAPGMG
jgi:serine/threonine-protein kinase HipA